MVCEMKRNNKTEPKTYAHRAPPGIGSSNASWRIEPTPRRTSNHLYKRCRNVAAPGCFAFGMVDVTRGVLSSELVAGNTGNEPSAFHFRSCFRDRPLNAVPDPKPSFRPWQRPPHGMDK